MREMLIAVLRVGKDWLSARLPKHPDLAAIRFGHGRRACIPSCPVVPSCPGAFVVGERDFGVCETSHRGDIRIHGEDS